jgi:hypothetical protein
MGSIGYRFESIVFEPGLRFEKHADPQLLHCHILSLASERLEKVKL